MIQFSRVIRSIQVRTDFILHTVKLCYFFVVYDFLFAYKNIFLCSNLNDLQEEAVVIIMHFNHQTFSHENACHYFCKKEDGW